MLRKYAERLGLNVFVFTDKPVPQLTVTMEMFHRALVVVAPHGAGEANILFSQRGTVLIEGLCYSGGRINLCYQVRRQKCLV